MKNKQQKKNEQQATEKTNTPNSSPAPDLKELSDEASEFLTQEQIDALMGYENDIKNDADTTDTDIAQQSLIQQLHQDIENLTTEKDNYLRAASEAENMRRRAVKEKDDALRYGGMKLARDIIPAIDTLQQALAQPPADLLDNAQFTGFLDGLKMTQKIFTDTLAGQNITPIAQIGDKFDPNLHQAVSEMPINDTKTQEKGTIAHVMQQGYILHDRLIRAAMVAVFK